MRKRKMTNRSKGMALAKAQRRAFTLSSIIFEDFIRENVKNGHMKFTLNVMTDDDVVTVMVKPDGKDDPTFMGYLMRSSIEPKRAIDNIMKFFKQESTPENSI